MILNTTYPSLWGEKSPSMSTLESIIQITSNFTGGKKKEKWLWFRPQRVPSYFPSSASKCFISTLHLFENSLSSSTFSQWRENPAPFQNLALHLPTYLRPCFCLSSSQWSPNHPKSPAGYSP